MTAVAVALAGIVAVQLGLLVWLVVRALTSSDQQGDTRVAVTQLEADVERMAFDLEATRGTLSAERKRADALEEIIADEVNAPPGLPLDARGVRDRLLRTAQRWREAAAATGASAEGAVPADGASTGTTATELPVTRPSDV
jgi:hypothetical protein